MTNAILSLGVSLMMSGVAAAQCTPGWVSPFAGLTGTAGHAVLPLPDGNMVVSGSFSAAGGVTAQMIAHVNTTTHMCSPLGNGTGSGNILQCVALLPDGDVLAGGNQLSIGGVTINRIGRFDEATQTWADINYGTQGGVVYAILVMPSGNEIIVGGAFSRAQGQSVNHIARCNLLTNQWSTLGSNMLSSGDQVNALALAPDGTVIVAGTFLNAGGSGSLRISRLNPANNTWSPLGSGVNNSVTSVVVLDDGDVVAAGYFTLAGGVNCNRLARYDVQTGTWSALGGPSAPGMSYINDIVKLPDGDLVVGGSFTAIGGIGAARIARCNPDADTFSPLGAGVNSDVKGLGVLVDGRVVATGNFSNQGSRLAAYSFGGTTPVITSPPQDVTLCGPGPAAFTVSNTGSSPLGYLWKHNNVAIDTSANPSAATPTLTLPAADSANSGLYTVTVSNSCGSATSSSAVLAVNTADFNGDGDIGTDADIEAFFACLGGTCCLTCGSADFNADGDIGTDADIESFFRVLGGGAC